MDVKSSLIVLDFFRTLGRRSCLIKGAPACD